MSGTTVVVTCHYCGYTFEATVHSKSDVESLTCFKCGDSNATVQPKGDYFGYGNDGPKPDAYIKKKLTNKR